MQSTHVNTVNTINAVTTVNTVNTYIITRKNLPFIVASDGGHSHPISSKRVMTNFNFIREISSYVKFANTVNTVKPVNTVNTVNTIYTVNTVNEVNGVNSVNTLNTVNTINTADTVNTSKPSASSGRLSSIFFVDLSPEKTLYYVFSRKIFHCIFRKASKK